MWLIGWKKWFERRELLFISRRLIVIVAAIIGVYKIKVSGSLIEDMPKSLEFYKDIKFFESEFGGIMPLEILIDTKKEKGVMKLSTLKKMEKLNECH